jgi:DNA-binding NarL/FixJ family response regulator
MIVDDRGDVRELLRAIVEDAPEDVAVAGEADGGHAALRSIGAVDPDVVVLDAFMPDLNGLDAAPLILERRPGQAIILFTGILDEETCERAERIGIAACLSKDDLEAIPRVATELVKA